MVRRDTVNGERSTEMRKPPKIDYPNTIKHRETGLIEQKREYQLITPLYGGGVTPGEADPVTIIRATEIRGNLRFWWRATRGRLFGDDRVAMLKREGEIWGAAYKKEEVKKEAKEAEQPEAEDEDRQ